jgi:hypothetical protein
MARSDGKSDPLISLSETTKESNKFYSILLDASTSDISESTYDIAERILRGETENAGAALEHLWSLKKAMRNENEIETVAQLITYYQKKMDIVRSKEEHIKKVSRDSRGLLDEKRRRDSESKAIAKEITEAEEQLAGLTAKLETLRTKQREFALADAQAKKELEVNENEVVSGLYEIILSQAEEENPVEKFTRKLKNRIADPAAKEPVPAENAATAAEREVGAALREARKEQPSADAPIDVDILESDKEKTSSFSIEALRKAGDLDARNGGYKNFPEPEPPPFPKSVVKTGKGRVIGEYFYDPKAAKEKRHYIYNSRFLLDALTRSLSVLTETVDLAAQAELLQVIRDVYKRTAESTAMHLAVSTSEILNENTLKALWRNVKALDFAEASRFRGRLDAKMNALRYNYFVMLREQMSRHVSS